MPRVAQSMPTGPSADDLEKLERAALEAEVRRLRAEVAAAPKAPPVVAKAPAEPEAPKRDSDLHGPITIPVRFHGIHPRDPVVISGKSGAKSFYPGSTYKTGPNGTPLTVGEVRTILNGFSEDCWRLKMKDVNDGELNVNLGTVNENG